jgi:cell division protein FtsB
MLYRNFRSSILQRFLVWAGMLLVLGALFAADLVQHRLKLEQAIVGLQQTTAKTGELTIVATRLHEYG